MTAEMLMHQYHEFSGRDVVLTFKGALSQDILVNLGDVLRNQLGFEGKAKKLFAIFVEATQNIKNYSAETKIVADGHSVGVGIVAVWESPEGYFMLSGNKIHTTSAARIQQHCAHIKTMPYEQLRSYHRERMRQAPPEGSKGAGLGLIDIAMKANQDVEFQCSPLDDEYSFFTINACIRKGLS